MSRTDHAVEVGPAPRPPARAAAAQACVALLVTGLVMAAVTQNFRLGRGMTVSGSRMPESFSDTLVVGATALLIGAWWFSRFRLRTVAAAVGLLALWGGVLLVEGPSIWQIAAMVVVAAVALSLLVPGRAGPRTG